jgi:hypothetical protein
MIRITFLGTVAARPTPTRNVSSLVLQREGELMMFDCGEGTQRQMMRYGTGFGRPTRPRWAGFRSACQARSCGMRTLNGSPSS